MNMDLDAAHSRIGRGYELAKELEHEKAREKATEGIINIARQVRAAEEKPELVEAFRASKYGAEGLLEVQETQEYDLSDDGEEYFDGNQRANAIMDQSAGSYLLSKSEIEEEYGQDFAEQALVESAHKRGKAVSEVQENLDKLLS